MQSLVWPSRRYFVLACVLVVAVLAMACAKSEKQTAAPGPAKSPAPAQAPTPAAGPAPAAAPVAAPAIVRPNSGPYTVAPGIENLPLYTVTLSERQAKDKGAQILRQYSGDKLPLWDKASYGGEAKFPGWASPVYFNPFKTVILNRVTYGGVPIRLDQGRCSLQGKTDLSVCDGKRAEVYAGVLVPDIFTRWEQPDPLSYIFSVRRGVMWPALPPMTRQDRELTADDMVWYFETQKKEGIFKGTFELVDTIQAADRYTVKIAMKAPHADFVRGLANTGLAVVPKECHDPKACADKNMIISPGPFIIKDVVSRESTLYVKNQEYHIKGAPWLDRIVTINITDPAAQKAAFLSGQIDNFRVYRPSEMEFMVKQRPGIQVMGAIATVGFEHYRVQLKGPLADVRVRRALVQAVDWPSMYEAAQEGFKLMGMHVPFEYLGLTVPVSVQEAGKYYAQDVAAAKKLLTEAGFPNGFPIVIQTSIPSGSWYDLHLSIQADWKKNLNVEAKIQVLDGVAHTSNLYTGTWTDLWFSVCWLPGCGGSDVDSYFLQEVSNSPQNFNKVNDPVIDELFRKQRGELDPAKRRDLIWQYQRYAWEMFYTIGLDSPTAFELMQPWELNATMHTYMWLGGVNGSTWTHMFDLSKLKR